MDVERAEKLARDCHFGQKDKLGRPYIEHVEQVVENTKEIIYDLNITNYLHFNSHENFDEFFKDTIVSAWLHDVFEDCDSDGLRWHLWSSELSPFQRRNLEVLTKDKNLNYHDYIRLCNSYTQTRIVKLADLKHNMDSDRLHCLDDATRDRLKKKYCYARGIIEGWVD